MLVDAILGLKHYTKTWTNMKEDLLAEVPLVLNR